jgi:hypothetical protein
MKVKVLEEILINFCKINMLIHRKLNKNASSLKKIFNRTNKNLHINLKLTRILQGENKVVKVALFLKDFTL